MFNWLDNMRKQPLARRRFVAFSITLLFTGALFVVWLTVWLPDFNNQTAVAEKTAEFSTPKDTFTQNFASSWSAISGQFTQLKQSIENVNVTGSLSSGVQYTATSTAISTKKDSGVQVIEMSSSTQSVDVP
jgi:predicted PurR-regulated permease PerM